MRIATNPSARAPDDQSSSASGLECCLQVLLVASLALNILWLSRETIGTLTIGTAESVGAAEAQRSLLSTQSSGAPSLMEAVTSAYAQASPLPEAQPAVLPRRDATAPDAIARMQAVVQSLATVHIHPSQVPALGHGMVGALASAEAEDNETQLLPLVPWVLGDDVRDSHQPNELKRSLSRPLSDAQVAAKLTIGGKPCATEELQALVQRLHNIVLIININYDGAARATAGFLRHLYGRFFDHVLLIGPNPLPDIGLLARGQNPVRQAWQYAYFYFPTILAKYPNAEGFLWTNDDVVMNYWNLKGANKSKLWLPDCKGNSIFVPFQTNLAEERNDGWSAQWSKRRSAMLALSQTDVKYIYQHRASILPRVEGYAKRVVDCFYVPRRLAEPLAFDLIPVFRDHMVWSEIAIPMMFYCLEHPESFDQVFSTMAYVWERGPLYDPRKYWHPELSAYHHWKLSSETMRDRLLGSMAAVDPCLTNITASDI